MYRGFSLIWNYNVSISKLRVIAGCEVMASCEEG